MILLNAQAFFTTSPPPFPSPYTPSFSRTISSLAFPSSNVSIFSSKFSSASPSFRCCCFTNNNNNNNDNLDNDFSEGFSVLSQDIPWDSGSIWSTMAGYFFSLHVPLSFGGLSMVSQLLHQPILDPETKAVSLLLVQFMELVGAFALLVYTAKPHCLFSFFPGKISRERNWIQASILGLGFLAVTVLLTSLLADRVMGPKDVNNPMLKEILSSSSLSKVSCFFLYCFVAPLLEETVYRGFLLTSLASKMKWQQAVIISSCIFSAAHFSGENSLQLFLIGCVLGCAYTWTGTLASSFTIHSLYNAAILFSTILS